jgi:hypothetical protein
MQNKPITTHTATTRDFTETRVVSQNVLRYSTRDLGVPGSGGLSQVCASTGPALQTPVMRGLADESSQKKSQEKVTRSYDFLQLVLQTEGMSVTSPSIRYRTFGPLMGKSGSEYSAAARSP